jgi:hypothetical protein
MGRELSALLDGGKRTSKSLAAGMAITSGAQNALTGLPSRQS